MTKVGSPSASAKLFHIFMKIEDKQHANWLHIDTFQDIINIH